MGYRHISLSCKCGQIPSHIDEVGLTDDHELVIHWWCEQCKRVVYASKALAECWKDCPRPEPRPDLLEEKLEACYDAKFLQSLGIAAE